MTDDVAAKKSFGQRGGFGETFQFAPLAEQTGMRAPLRRFRISVQIEFFFPRQCARCGRRLG